MASWLARRTLASLVMTECNARMSGDGGKGGGAGAAGTRWEGSVSKVGQESLGTGMEGRGAEQRGKWMTQRTVTVVVEWSCQEAGGRTEGKRMMEELGQSSNMEQDLSGPIRHAMEEPVGWRRGAALHIGIGRVVHNLAASDGSGAGRSKHFFKPLRVE